MNDLLAGVAALAQLLGLVSAQNRFDRAELRARVDETVVL
jgi:hypothetical protein